MSAVCAVSYTHLYKLAENYDELISSTLVGNNVVNIAATTIGTLLFVGWLGSNGATVSTIFMTVITLVFGEITPKSLAKECPEKFAITAVSYTHLHGDGGAIPKSTKSSISVLHFIKSWRYWTKYDCSRYCNSL